jgi:diguanylate cyclase (GGDEF)-like protein/PAS domain S-box-containing protein
MRREPGWERHPVPWWRVDRAYGTTTAAASTGTLDIMHPAAGDGAVSEVLDISALGRALVEQAQDIIVLLDDDGIIRFVNPALSTGTGWRVDEVLGTNIMDLVHPDDVERAIFDFSVYSSEGAVPGSSHYRIRTADGTWRLFDASAADISIDGRHRLALYARPDESASPAVLYGLLRGTSTSEMLRPVCNVVNWHIHGSRVGISWCEDDAFQSVGTDLPPELVGGDSEPGTPWATARTTATAQRAADHSHLDDTRRAIAERLGLGAYWIEPVFDDRAEVCALITVWMRAGGFVPEIHTLGMNMASDYTELIIRWTRQRRLLDDAAHRDALTSVANRKAFVDALEKAGEGGAVLYCDLDGFKAVNDALGHNAGDELLRAVARRIQACIRKDDVVGRLGGDEFAVLTTNVTREQVLALADRIVAAVAEPFKVSDTTTTVGISIGLAFSEDRVGAEMLELADRGLYRAKVTGVSAISWFDE